MNFLTRILAVDVPENTKLSTAELSFRGLTLGWLLLLLFVVLVGIGLVALFYLMEKGTLGWGRRVVLVGLRCALLVLLMFLILRPVLLAEFVGDRPQGVALLIDASQSMQQRDHRLTDTDKNRVALAKGEAFSKETPSDPSRKEMVDFVLANPELKLIPKLQELGPLRPYFFGSDVRGLPEDGKSKKTLTERIATSYQADESQTALADSIMRILQSKDKDLPGSIVVMTDGQDNASKFTLQEAAMECRRLKVPLHIYGVGSSESGQLQLKEVAAPETLFADDSVSIPLRWRAQGFTEGNVKVTLTLGGKEVASKEVKVKTGEDLRDVLGFVVPREAVKDNDPQKRETQDLVATLQYKVGDKIVIQDTVKQTLRVIDSKIKILYIERAPRGEYEFLQRILLRDDKRLQVDFLLLNADEKITKKYDEKSPYLFEFPKERRKFFEAKYNLIILGDVPSTYFSKEQQEWISELVANRGGLLVIAGQQYMPNTYENTPLETVLPIEFTKQKFGLDTEVRTQEYPPTLTEAGLRTDWLALADTAQESQDVWEKKLRGFHWYFPVTKLRPAATALIVNPRAKMGDQPMPILVSQFYGKGQALWMGTNETWRWRWNNEDKYFVRFWGQIIYQLGLPSLLGDGTKRVQMALDRSQAVAGKSTTIFVRMVDKEFKPRTDEKVNAELVYLDAKPGEENKTAVTMQALKGRPGEYKVLVVVPPERAGRYELQVNNPEVNTFSFRVDLPPKHEREEAGLAVAPLLDAAEISKGRFYREEDLPNLVGSLMSQTTPFVRRQEVLLWNPLAIIMFVGLITAEWLVRKFSDLS